MKLFLISQDQNNDYDTYDSAVVAAESEDEARQTDPSNGQPIDWAKKQWAWCDTADAVVVTYLGEAADAIERGVVCASYNAG